MAIDLDSERRANAALKKIAHCAETAHHALNTQNERSARASIEALIAEAHNALAAIQPVQAAS